MEFSVQELAAMLGAEVVGHTTTRISGLAKIEDGKPGTISFLANPRYLPHLYTTGATAVLVPSDFTPDKPVQTVLLKVKDPYSAFTLLLEKAQSMLLDKKGIETPCFTAVDAEIGDGVYIGAFSYVGKKAKIGNNVKIYPFAYVGDHAVIGDGSILYPNSTVYYGCQLGKNCILHAGSVIGSDGFGFAPQADGSMKKIPQTGIVVLEDGVEVGANTTIDRATLGETVLRAGVKLDNLVQIAHNVEIGRNTVIAAQAGISGSTKLGENCMVGGQVGIVGHIKLADRTQIGAQSGVSKTVKETGKALRGSPAQEYRQQLRSEALFRQFEALEKRIRILEKQLEDQKQVQK